MSWLVVAVMAFLGIALVAIAVTGSQSKVWGALTNAVHGSGSTSTPSTGGSTIPPPPVTPSTPGYRPSLPRLGTYG